MGQDLYEKFPAAKEIFDRADAILPFKVTELCFAGPAGKIKRHRYPAAGRFRHVRRRPGSHEGPDKFKDLKPAYLAGLSLGEYTAYYAAGSLDFESAVKLVAARSRFMQEAATAADSTMVAIVGLEDPKVIELCNQAREGEVLVPANFNCPGQVVASGHRGACTRLAALAEPAGAMKAIVLDVAGAFHSPLMQSAADKLKAVLDATEFQIAQTFPLSPTSIAISIPTPPISDKLSINKSPPAPTGAGPWPS